MERQGPGLATSEQWRWVGVGVGVRFSVLLCKQSELTLVAEHDYSLSVHIMSAADYSMKIPPKLMKEEDYVSWTT